MRKGYPASILGCLLGATLVALAAQPGCQNDGASPEDIPTGKRVVFTPAATAVEAVRGLPINLSARADGVGDFTTVFTRGRVILGVGTELAYVPVAFGADSVLATVTYDDIIEYHLWRLNVISGNPLTPPAPLDFQVIITDQVYVTWSGETAYHGEAPLSRYELRALPRDFVTEYTWDLAHVLAEVAFEPGRSDYLVVRAVADPVLPIGTPIGFALRLITEDGEGSPLARDDVFIPQGYIVEGRVTDPSGRPIPNVEVHWSYCDGLTHTDEDGRYVSYLLPRHEVVGIRYSDDGVGVPGTGAFYDAAFEWQVDGEHIQDVMLLPVGSIDTACDVPRYAGQFLNYMRDMTATDASIYARTEYTSHRWPTLPITVNVADRLNANGTFSLGALADSALTTWNDRLGEDYFVPAAPGEPAQVSIFFADDGMAGLIGVTRISEPYGVQINEATPRRMTVQLRVGFQEPTYAFEVLLHEIGHAFCIGGHSRCNGGIHLMQSNPQGIIAARWPLSPISDDEVNLVKTLYGLPADLPLDIYRAD